MPNQVDAPILRRDAIFLERGVAVTAQDEAWSRLPMVSNIAVQAKVCEYRVHLSNMMPREVGERA